MKVAIVGDMGSVHIQRYMQWLSDKDIDTLPVSDMEPALAKYRIDRFEPHIVHAFWLPTWGVYAYNLGCRPLAVTALGSDLLQESRFSNNDQIDELLKHADLFMGYSPEVVSLGIRRGANPKKSHATPIGVDTKKFYPTYSPLWRRFHKTEKTKVILAPRHMSELYNHETIVRAMPKLIDRYGDISLVFLSTENGDPYYAKFIADMIDELKLTEHVFSNVKLSYVRMSQAYNAADVVMSTPSTDGQSLTNLEAMACMRPIVATNCASNRATLPQKWLVNPFNVQDVEETVMAILDGKTCNKDILKRNRSFVKASFELDDTMGRIVNLYEETICA